MTELFERRLRSEWALLQALSACNPGRLTALEQRTGEFHLGLRGPHAMSLRDGLPQCIITTHAVRMDFPVHFPAVPMEMFLATPVFHPNVHPETGFVCLWERHRVSNTVEHALHKLVAMLAGELRNTSPLHVMQPAAVDAALQYGPAMPLQGVAYEAAAVGTATSRRRQRLQ